MRQVSYILLTIVLSCAVIVSAQSECSPLVNEALDKVDTLCEGVDRNQACYGHTDVTATDFGGKTISTFAGSGDIVSIDHIANIRTAPLSLQESVWGIALLSLQANLPDTSPGQNVTIILFGDTEIVNEVTPSENGTVLSATASGNINVRGGPGTNYPVVSVLNAAETVDVVGRNQVGDWVQIEQEDGSLAWVFASLLAVDGDISELAVRASGYINPMQAFRFSTSIGQSTCEDLPQDGLLIQAPQETVVNFSINGIEVEIGSTAVIRSDEDTLTLSTLAGSVVVGSAGVKRTVEPGFQTRVTVGQVPSQAEAYSPTDVRNVPVGLLPEHVDIPLPAGTEVGMVQCVYGGESKAHVPADKPVIVRIGWASQTLEELTEFMNTVTVRLDVDGESQPLWSLIGPEERDTGDNRFVIHWYWVLEPEAPEIRVTVLFDMAHPLVLDGEETAALDPYSCFIFIGE